MQRRTETPESSRFRGGLRQHHRTGSKTPSTWEQWIAEDRAAFPTRHWLRILGTILGILALIAIGAGLYIELR